MAMGERSIEKHVDWHEVFCGMDIRDGPSTSKAWMKGKVNEIAAN